MTTFTINGRACAVLVEGATPTMVECKPIYSDASAFVRRAYALELTIHFGDGREPVRALPMIPDGDGPVSIRVWPDDDRTHAWHAEATTAPPSGLCQWSGGTPPCIKNAVRRTAEGSAYCEEHAAQLDAIGLFTKSAPVQRCAWKRGEAPCTRPAVRRTNPPGGEVYCEEHAQRLDDLRAVAPKIYDEIMAPVRTPGGSEIRVATPHGGDATAPVHGWVDEYGQCICGEVRPPASTTNLSCITCARCRELITRQVREDVAAIKAARPLPEQRDAAEKPARCRWATPQVCDVPAETTECRDPEARAHNLYGAAIKVAEGALLGRLFRTTREWPRCPVTQESLRSGLLLERVPGNTYSTVAVRLTLRCAACAAPDAR